MASWKKIAEDYFVFSRRDRIGILVLVFLIILIALLPAFVKRNSASRVRPADSSLVNKIERLRIRTEEKESKYQSNDYRRYQHYEKRDDYRSSLELFPFDPNTTTADEWKRLGLKEKTIQTIIHYREKGGKFKSPSDLEKIYGIRRDELERLLPFVKISPSADSGVRRKSFADTGFAKTNDYKNYQYRGPMVDINAADSAEWIALPGIASKLCWRIMDFRDRLGGFISIEQVGQTYGLPDSTFQRIKPFLVLEDDQIRKININAATIDGMKSHPYLKWSVANAIIAYRVMHGPYKSIEEIKKIMPITDELFNKLKPYLKVD